MKKTLLFTLQFLFLCQFVFAQDFKTTWTASEGTIIFGATTTGPVSYTWQSVSGSNPTSGSGTFTGPIVTIIGLPTVGEFQLSIQPLNFQRFVLIPDVFIPFGVSSIRSINQ